MRKSLLLLLIFQSLFLSIVFIACKRVNHEIIISSNVNSQNFDKVIKGKQVNVFFLKNGNIGASITNYGGRIVSLLVPDKFDQLDDVVVGFKSIEEYINAKGQYHGAIIGRVANRIAKGNFEVNGENYELPINNGLNHIHGGSDGFHNQVWDVKTVNDTSIVLRYLSVDGEMGYPGNLQIEVIYALSSSNELSITYKAETDKNTPFNPTNHAFFNLAGEGNGSINNHLLTINASMYTCVDSVNIPMYDEDVTNTPFDFRVAKLVGQDINQSNVNVQLKRGGGYDHNYILTKNQRYELSLAARVIERESGRKMDVYTNASCMQFFSGNFFDGTDIGKSGKPILSRESFAIETQAYPDAPNQEGKQSIILHPDDIFSSITIYDFSTVKR